MGYLGCIIALLTYFKAAAACKTSCIIAAYESLRDRAVNVAFTGPVMEYTWHVLASYRHVIIAAGGSTAITFALLSSVAFLKQRLQRRYAFARDTTPTVAVDQYTIMVTLNSMISLGAVQGIEPWDLDAAEGLVDGRGLTSTLIKFTPIFDNFCFAPDHVGPGVQDEE